MSTWKTVAAEDHVSQRVGLVDRDQLPVGDERDAVAVLRLRHVLSDHQERAALVAQVAELPPDRLAQDRIDLV